MAKRAPLFGIEALDGFHQADIAFLDEIAARESVARIIERERGDEPQMRKRESARGFDVVVASQARGQFGFFGGAQHWDGGDLAQIARKAAGVDGRAGERRLRRGDGGGENVFHWIARLRFVALALSCVERQFYAQNAVESNPRARVESQ